MMRRKTLKWIAGSLIMLLLQIPFLCRDMPLLVFRLMSESPLACGTVTSGYGLRIAPIRGGIEFHDGVDFSAPEGTPIAAIADGTVVETGYGSGYGNYIVLQHKCNVKSLYAHCSAVFAEKGDKVERGEIIAAVGSTGLSTGSHLHLQIEYRGKTIPPRKAVRY